MRLRDGLVDPQGRVPFSATTTFKHVAFTYDHATLRLYVDGTLVASVAEKVRIRRAKQPLTLGSQAGAHSWSGKIDEVRVYDRGLSAAEVQELYENP